MEALRKSGKRFKVALKPTVGLWSPQSMQKPPHSSPSGGVQQPLFSELMSGQTSMDRDGSNLHPFCSGAGFVLSICGCIEVINQYFIITQTSRLVAATTTPLVLSSFGQLGRQTGIRCKAAVQKESETYRSAFVTQEREQAEGNHPHQERQRKGKVTSTLMEGNPFHLMSQKESLVIHSSVSGGSSSPVYSSSLRSQFGSVCLL